MSGSFFNSVPFPSGSGGTDYFFWDPVAKKGEYGYQVIEAGVPRKGLFNIVNNATLTTIDQVPQNTTVGTTIAFVDNGDGWSIVSQTSQQARYTTPSTVADEAELNATFPTPEDNEGQYCRVQSTNTYWTVRLDGLTWIWYDTLEIQVENSYSKDDVNSLLQTNSTTDRNRDNHTGTQLASTISDFDTEVANNPEVLTNTNARHTHANKAILDATEEAFTTAEKTAYNMHVESAANPHGVTKAQVGLGNADNTSDMDKPVSTEQQNALDTKVDKVVGKQLSTEDYTTAEKTKLAGIEDGAEVNIQADWEQADNLQDSYIQNKPTLGTVASKDVGTAIGNIQENGAILGNSEIVETDATGKFITSPKNTAYNKNFGTLNNEVAQGDASYLKEDTYTKIETNALLLNKEDTSNKGVPNGYASLDGAGKVPASQLPSFVDDVLEYADLASFPTTGETGKVYVALDTNLTYRWSGSVYVKLNDVDVTNYFNKVTDTTDNITEGTAKFTTQTDIDKLAGIEANATADQTAAEIKTAYESNVDTNAFTDAEKTKLSNITITQPVDLDQIEADTAANNDKITNQTHTGEVTGDTALTIVNNVVVNSKLAQVATNTVKGRITDGNGNVEDIQIDTTLKTALNLNNVTNDAQLKIASNLSDVDNQQTALNNITNVASATNEYILTKDTLTGNAIFKPAPGGAGGTNLSIGARTSTSLDINSDTGNNATVPPASAIEAGLLTASDKNKLDGITGINTGDEVAATETTAGKVELASQTEAEAGTDDTNKAMNPLKTKQAFDAFIATFIAAHEAQKIINTRIENNEVSYGSDIDIQTSTEIKSRGSITYLNGIYTVGKDCTLLVSCTLTFRNNSAPTNDNSYLNIFKSTDNGSTFTSLIPMPIEPSNLIDSTMYLGQSLTDFALDLNNGDKFKISITNVNASQYVSYALVTVKEQ